MKQIAFATVLFLCLISAESLQANQAKPFRILILSPGLSFDGVSKDANPVLLLEKFLNRRCENCFSLIDGSKQDQFVGNVALRIKDLIAESKPDFVVYYESGIFLSADIFESFKIRIDDDLEQPRQATEKELHGKFCCNFMSRFLPTSFSNRINTVLNYVNIYRQARLSNGGDLVAISDEAMRNFAYINRVSEGKFLLLLSPYGFKVDALTFEDDFLQNLLFKFLVHFYMPQKTPLARVYLNQGFAAVPVFDFQDLYQTTNLMHRHPYRLNAVGADIWAKTAGRNLLKFLRKKELVAREHQ